jgi:hypothetical protein
VGFAKGESLPVAGFASGDVSVTGFANGESWPSSFLARGELCPVSALANGDSFGDGGDVCASAKVAAVSTAEAAIRTLTVCIEILL